MGAKLIKIRAETVSLQEAAAILGTSPRHAYQLHRDRRFPVPTIRVGRRIVVSRRALQDLLDGSSVSRPTEAADA